jgi:hypothetical protein
VANVGYWDGTFVVVWSHVIEHGGVKTVVRAASGGVMAAVMVRADGAVYAIIQRSQVQRSIPAIVLTRRVVRQEL